MATVEDLPTGRVVGQYLFVSQDNEDAGTAPNAIIVEGYVRFTCSAPPPLKYKSLKVSAVPLVHDAIFDSQGFLMPMNPTYSAIPGKIEPGLELLADGPGVNPRGFTWMVSFNLREVSTGRAIDIASFPIYVAEDAEIDLTDVAPISEANGARIIRGDSAYEIAQQAGYFGTMEEWLESLKGEQGDQGDSITGPPGPTPQISIGEVITTPNPADDSWLAPIILNGSLTKQAMRDAFPTTMQGAKGETGIGWSPATLYNIDANTVLIAGTYRITGTASQALNYPAATAGTLSVESRIAPAEQFGPSVVQTFTPFFGLPEREGRVFYRRVLTGGNWQPWRAYTSQRVDQTAGRAIYTWDDVNNREQLIYGDTGLRDVTSLMINGWTTQTGTGLYLRRVGSTVTLNGILDGTNKTIDEFVDLGTAANGFTNQTSFLMSPVVTSDYSETRELLFAGTKLYVRSAGKKIYRLNAMWLTNQTWPTTLPGVATGSTPNL